jgi:hypothetical protein
MQNLITIVILIVLLALLAVLPALDRSPEQQRQANPRAPIVWVDRGA